MKTYVRRKREGSGRVVVVMAAAAVFLVLMALPALANPVSMGPQAMEGDLKAAPGDMIQGGFDFKIQNGVGGTVSFVGAKLTFANIGCENGTTPTQTTIILDMDSPTYTVAAGNSDWVPTGDQSSTLVYQGNFIVPQICGEGVKVRFNHGATFTADLQSSNLAADIHIRWHYRHRFASGNFTSGSWSGTGDFQPDVLIPVGTIGLLGLAIVLGAALVIQQRRSRARSASATVRQAA